MPFISRRRILSTMLVSSTKSLQLTVLKKRKLLMLLLTETCVAAWFWLSSWISSMLVNPISESLCSTQFKGNESALPFSCSLLVNSATNVLTIGGSDLAISAITNTRFFGSFSAISIISSAHLLANALLFISSAIITDKLLRFSISANRNIIGIAHNSPIFK